MQIEGRRRAAVAGAYSMSGMRVMDSNMNLSMHVKPEPTSAVVAHRSRVQTASVAPKRAQPATLPSPPPPRRENPPPPPPPEHHDSPTPPDEAAPHQKPKASVKKVVELRGSQSVWVDVAPAKPPVRSAAKKRPIPEPAAAVVTVATAEPSESEPDDSSGSEFEPASSSSGTPPPRASAVPSPLPQRPAKKVVPPTPSPTTAAKPPPMRPKPKAFKRESEPAHDAEQQKIDEMKQELKDLAENRVPSVVTQLEYKIMSSIASGINDNRASTHAILAVAGVNSNPFHVGNSIRNLVVRHGDDRPNPDRLTQINTSVVAIPRAYLQEQLQESDTLWPPCYNGSACEGMKLSNVPIGDRFTVRAFFMRREVREINGCVRPTEAALMQMGRVCLLCNRTEALLSYVSIKENHEGLCANTSVSDHSVIVDVPYEYTLESTVCSKPNVYEGIIKPFILHERHMYKLERRNGCKIYIELYPYPPEAMRNAPPNRDCANNARTYTRTADNRPTPVHNGDEILHQGF